MTTIALLQFDPTVGDLDHNGRRLAALAHQALSGGAKVGISTELAVSGYPPRVLLMERDFVERSMTAALTLETPLPVLVGKEKGMTKDSGGMPCDRETGGEFLRMER